MYIRFLSLKRNIRHFVEEMERQKDVEYGQPVKVEFKNTSMKVITVDLETPIPADKTYNYLYFVFTEASKGTQVDYYKFNPCLADEMTPIVDVEEDAGEEPVVFYSMDGKRLSQRPERGTYIRTRVMSDGSRKSVKQVR